DFDVHVDKGFDKNAPPRAFLDSDGDAVPSPVRVAISRFDGAEHLDIGGYVTMEDRQAFPMRRAPLSDIENGKNLLFGDWLGDGRLNLLWFDTANADIEVYSLIDGLLQGHGPVPWSTFQPFSDATHGMDVDGDGLSDLGFITKDRPPGAPNRQLIV